MSAGGTVLDTKPEEEKTKIVDVELSEDLQEFISLNPDVKFKEPQLKTEIKQLLNGTLMQVEKEIGSSTTIISIQEVTDELIESML